MIKALFVTHYSDLYGANKSMLALIEYLIKYKEMKIDVLVPNAGMLTAELDKLGVCWFQERYFYWESSKFGLKEIIKNIYNHFWAMHRIIRICGNDYDIVYSNSSVIYQGQKFANYYEIPHVWHLREFGYEDYNLKYTVPQRFVDRMMTKADCLICISKAVYEKYGSICKSGKYEVVYNGVTLKSEPKESENKTDITNTINSTDINFVCVGLIQEKKGQKDIIEALALLVASGKRNVHVHFVGDGNNQYIGLLKDYIRQNELEKYVTFWGFVENVREILKKMDVGIMSSVQEAFGRVTVEYMLSEMPVIGTDSGGTKEIIYDGVTGMIYPVGNIGELAKAMRRYVDNNDLVAIEGKRGKEEAERRFTVERNAEDIYRIMQEVLCKKRLDKKEHLLM